MAIAAKKNYTCDGVEKVEFSRALQQVSDQIRLTEQKLTMKIENELEKDYKKQQEKILSAKLFIANIS
ncbi:hypothetical protein ACFQ3N_09650 [Virgibacillus byunsanensis]|uniref:Uncharacterized protein n=1 Tax=Virgibacillus byunsanensis TaxID=570945 RepID=A0ABW3LKV3_9BACI